MRIRPDRYLPLLNAVAGLPNSGISPVSAELLFTVDLLQAEQHISGNIAEIGVAYGGSAIFLAQLLRAGERLYLNDLFGDDKNNVSRSFVNAHRVENVAVTFQERLGSSDRLVFLAKPSSSLTLDDMENVRIFHIDGGHSFAEITSDLRFATSVLHKRGVIVVDDMTTETGWRAIYYALREFAEERSLEKQWFVPHFSNKGVLVPERNLFDVIYGAFRDAACTASPNQGRTFNLSNKSFEGLYSPSAFLSL